MLDAVQTCSPRAFATWQGLAQKTAPTLANSVFGRAERQGVSKKIYKDDKAVFTNLFGRPPPDLWLGGWGFRGYITDCIAAIIKNRKITTNTINKTKAIALKQAQIAPFTPSFS